MASKKLHRMKKVSFTSLIKISKSFDNLKKISGKHFIITFFIKVNIFFHTEIHIETAVAFLRGKKV